MSHPISRTVLHVCFVAQNSLAETFLVQLLRANRHLCPLTLEGCARLSPTSRRNIVFVIDQCGLEMSLHECLKELREYCPNAKFLLLDYEKSKEEIVRLLIMGAHGYVPHAEVSRAIIPAILSIAEGQLWVTQEVLKEFLIDVGRTLRKDIHPRQTTTPREDEILELVRRRLSNREIADLLQIRVCTVKFHLSNILSKFHARSRRDLTIAPSGRPLKMLFPVRSVATRNSLVGAK